jgi:tetratricopeptide (TPR) repeat protein
MKKTVMVVFIVAFIFSYCAPNKVSVSAAKPRSGESYVICLTRGMSLLDQKKYDEAISELRQASILKPDSDRAYNFLGIGYFMKKNLEEALKCFQKALAINPTYAAAYCNLGNLQFKEGKVDSAVATLTQAITAIGDDAMLHFSLGIILLHKGEIDQGFAHLQKVMELDPGYLDREKRFSFETSEGGLPQPEIFFRYARLYAATGNLEKTLQYLDKAKKTGFVEWERIRHDDAFARLRDDPQVKKYLD